MNKYPFKCPACGHADFSEQNSHLKCTGCGTNIPFSHGVFDFLLNPTQDVVNELTGMALENKFEREKYLDFKIKLVENAPKLKNKLDVTKNDYNQYYQQTMINFQQAFNSIVDKYNFKKARVLEIGACYDYYFLQPFHERGAECYGLNIHFTITPEQQFQDFPVKVLADMNSLPFVAESFDVIVISATSHHSNTPEKLVSEIFRVLKPGGSCLMINDPIHGLIKKFGSDLTMNRHDHINENEYSLQRYNTMFRKNGFQINHLFSEYHDLKLLNARIHPQVRFAAVARAVSLTWKVSFIRQLLKKYGLWFAQTIFGFPMNVVLIKRKAHGA